MPNAKTNHGRNSETKEIMQKRVAGQVTEACKVSHSAQKTIAEAFAGAVMFAMLHGETRFLNELFTGMTAKDAYALRALALPKLHETFGADVERDAEGKVTQRATPIIRFTANPKETGNHFALVRLNASSDGKQKAEYEGAKLKAAKQTKQNIIKAGEEEIAKMEWLTVDQAANLAGPFDWSKAADTLTRTLTKMAQNAFRMDGKIDDKKLKQISQLAGLSDEQWKKIYKAYTPNEPSADNDSDSNVPAEKEAVTQAA